MNTFPVPVLAEPCGPVERPQSGEARESTRAANGRNSRGGGHFPCATKHQLGKVTVAPGWLSGPLRLDPGSACADVRGDFSPYLWRGDFQIFTER